MKALFLAALIAFAPTARAGEWFEKPDATDIVFQSAFTGLMLVDWAQTLNFTNAPAPVGVFYQPLWESNVFLGKRPSSAEVNRYFAGCILGHALVSWALPKPWRNFWQTGGVVIEMYAIGSNIKNGVRLTVKF